MWSRDSTRLNERFHKRICFCCGHRESRRHFEIEVFAPHVVVLYPAAKLRYNILLVKSLHFYPIVTFLSVLLIVRKKKILKRCIFHQDGQ